MPNGPLLRTTMDYIEAHPEEHFQGEYAVRRSCGSAGCFATNAILIRFPDAVIQWRPTKSIERRRLGADAAEVAAIVEIDGVLRRIDPLAQEILELNEGQSFNLFYEENSVERLRELVDKYAASA